MEFLPLKTRIKEFAYLDVAQNGKIQKVIWDRIHDLFGESKPINLLKSRLHIAAESGDVGNAAATAISLLRSKDPSVSTKDIAKSLSLANANVIPIYEHQHSAIERQKRHSLLDWFTPRRWNQEGDQSDIEVNIRRAARRANRWQKYADEAHD